MSLKVSHHPATFCGRRHCGSGDIMVLVCHVISPNHLIVCSFDVMSKSQSLKVSYHPARFCGYCGSVDIMVLVSHVISQDQVE